MRESSQGEVPLAAPDRPEDRYGLASPPSGSVIAPVTRAGEANNVSTSRADQADPDEIAERVWQMMAERLVVEHERRGLGS